MNMHSKVPHLHMQYIPDLLPILSPSRDLGTKLLKASLISRLFRNKSTATIDYKINCSLLDMQNHAVLPCICGVISLIDEIFIPY